jgi:predicted RNase H-like HicB family nuclease
MEGKARLAGMRPRRLPTGEGNPLQIYIAMVEIQPIRVELDREEDGRVPASAPDLPGVMAYGVREEEAVRAVKSIALQVLADMIESGEEVFEPLKVLLAA